MQQWTFRHDSDNVIDIYFCDTEMMQIYRDRDINESDKTLAKTICELLNKECITP